MKNYNIHKNKKYEIKKWTWKRSPSGCACRFNIRYIDDKLKKKKKSKYFLRVQINGNRNKI